MEGKKWNRRKENASIDERPLKYLSEKHALKICENLIHHREIEGNDEKEKQRKKNKIEHVNIITIKRKRNQWFPDRKDIKIHNERI